MSFVPGVSAGGLGGGPVPPAKYSMRVIETSSAFECLSPADFIFDGRPSPLAIAYVSPHVDFAAVTATLKNMGNGTPVLAVTTAGELCADAKSGKSIYKDAEGEWTRVVVQIFPPDLLLAASLHTVPLHNDDIRRGVAQRLKPEARVRLIEESLNKIVLPFTIDSYDTVALTFVDGLSSSENYFMDAVYRTGRFPCIFIGGSAGGKPDFKNTYIFDGHKIVENRAVIVFLKLAPGRGYGAFKTQNFEKTSQSFIVYEADTDLRIVETVIDPISGEVCAFAEALAQAFDVPVKDVPEKLKEYTFGIEIEGELFVRSVGHFDVDTGRIAFFCDIYAGEQLILLKATNFVEHTRKDIDEFLASRPRPLGAVINDCALRRQNNPSALDEMVNLWPMPAAGFSTFGELFGININQTMTALVFFDTGGTFRDRFVAEFPVHYSRFCGYFGRRAQCAREELAQVQRKLAEKNSNKSAMVESIQESVVMITPQGIILSFNRGAEQTFQYKEEEVVGRSVEILMPPSYAVHHASYLSRYVQTGVKHIMGSEREVTGLRKDGTTFPVALGVNETILNGQRVFVGVMRDITVQKMREEELRMVREEAQAARRHMELILNSIQEGVFGLDAEGRTIFANRAGLQLIGYSEDEIIGIPQHDLVHSKRADGTPYPREECFIFKALSAGEGIALDDETFWRKDGKPITVEFTATPVKDQMGKVVETVMVFRDNSERKRVEKQRKEYIEMLHEQEGELREAKEDAEKANLAKSEFLANMSHELRTPLNGILGMLRFLRESRLADERYGLSEEAGMAEAAYRSSVTLLEIVNDILDLSKIEAKEMKLENIGMDLGYGLESTILTLLPIARDKHIGVVSKFNRETFPFVLGDSTRFKQILTNIIGNAIKYTHEGSVTVAAQWRPLNATQGEFYCEVIDTGIGIPSDKLGAVFEKFTQADSTTTRKYGGTGLGLAITKSLVEMMGGAIGVQSETGKGSTFWITIPFTTTETVGTDIVRPKTVEKKGDIPVKSARILIAEDHPMNQLLVKKIMGHLGVGHYLVVENGEDAVQAFTTEKWDMVLMDCHMPKKNGYDATIAIRQIEQKTGTHVPIIAMTADAMQGDREKCLQCGMDEYISKPIVMEGFQQVVGQWLSFKASDSRKESAAAEAAQAQKTFINLNHIREISGGDTDLEKSLVHAFLSQSDENILTMGAAMAGSNLDDWHKAAHMMKGGALGVGAETLAHLCNTAQHFKGSTDEQSELFLKIHTEYKGVCSCLRMHGFVE